MNQAQIAARVDRMMQTAGGRAELAAIRADAKHKTRAKATAALQAAARARRERKAAARRTSGKPCPGCTEGHGPLAVRSPTGTHNWHHGCYERARNRGGDAGRVQPAGLRTSRAG